MNIPCHCFPLLLLKCPLHALISSTPWMSLGGGEGEKLPSLLLHGQKQKPRKEPVPRSRPPGKRERQIAGSCVASSPCASPTRRAHAEPHMLLSPRNCGSKAGGQAGPGSPLPRVLTVPWALALFSGHAEKSWVSALLRSASLLLSSPLSPHRGLAAFVSEEQRTHCDSSRAPLVGLPSPLSPSHENVSGLAEVVPWLDFISQPSFSL